MYLEEIFTAQGHPYIRATHRTTLMITHDSTLTKRGDCVVAVSAEMGLNDIDSRLKIAMKTSEAKIVLTLKAGGHVFQVCGRGDPRLTFSHPSDMVIRKSGHVCGRTLMVYSDKSACDVPMGFLKLIQNSGQTIKISISTEK